MPEHLTPGKGERLDFNVFLYLLEKYSHFQWIGDRVKFPYSIEDTGLGKRNGDSLLGSAAAFLSPRDFPNANINGGKGV